MLTTAEVKATHDRLTRYIFGHFGRKLSFDECADVVGDALAELEGQTTTINEPDRWLRRAAWRNALDAVRRIEGEATVKRERPTGIDDHLDRLSDDGPHDLAAPLADAAAAQADQAALTQAMKTLTADEARVMHLRYFDGLDVPAIVERMGCSRHHYENLHKRAVRKLREGLVSAAAQDECRAARALAHPAHREAHVATCLSCRALERRRRGLLALLPLGLVPRLTKRLPYLASAKAAAAVVTATAVTAGAGTVAVEHTEHHHRHRAAAAHHLKRAKPAPPVVQTAARIATTTTAGPPPHTAPTRAQRSAHTAPTPASPFLPESTTPAATRDTPTATAASATTTSHTTTQPASSDAFSSEFHP